MLHRKIHVTNSGGSDVAAVFFDGIGQIADKPLLAAVVGALFVGIGAGVCVRIGGAPGGDDALENAALATSGNYHNFYTVNGRKYAHTIDPRTGRPVTHSLLSATVIARDCATADAYATAFMVMGLDSARQIVKADQAPQDAAQGAQAAATATETPKVSDSTIQAEKEAQRSLSAAKKTIDDARDVKVLKGSVSDGNVTGEVQLRKDEANAVAGCGVDL